MPGRPAKKGQKYNVTIEVKGPQGKAELASFRKGLKAALAKVKGKLHKEKKTGKARIEVMGPQGKPEFTAFKKGLQAALVKVKGKLGKGKKTGKAEPADT
jgi:hypothetical protein